MIYFIRAERKRIVKIGYSAGHPSVRLQALQCGSPVKLELIGMAEGGRKEEAAWHRRFAHLRLHGEWFKWTAELSKAARPYLRSTAERNFQKSQREWAELEAMLEQGRLKVCGPSKTANGART